MGNYEALKTAIAGVIKTNGNNAITGAILQNVLLTIISNVGANSQFIGIATPATNPGTPDQNVFYIATVPGVYPNFNITIEAEETAIILNKSGKWVKTLTGIFSDVYIKDVYGDNVVDGEYIRAYTDANGVFLWGIKKDGSVNWAKGIPDALKTYVNERVGIIYEVIETINNELTQVYGKISESSAKINAISQDLTNYKQDVKDVYGDNVVDGEYIRAYTDANGVFLWGIKKDGSVNWAKGIPDAILKYIDGSINPMADQLTKLQNYVSEISGVFNILSTIDLSEVDNYFEITIDSDSHLLAWRDRQGVKHEVCLQVERELRLSDKAMSIFIQSLIHSGFTVDNPIDYSNQTSINLPIPRYCAVVNIISPIGLAVTKTQNIPCYLEYLDKSGNYFKKPIILNAQGSSSMAYTEKNQSIDVYNDEDREEACNIIFGNWVAQDSFHLKCYYIDVFRGVCNIAYNWAEQIIKYMNSRNNRVMLNRDSITAYHSTGSFETDFGIGALCHPDGFPFEMYVNGEYYGLYAWNLKKHRKNYSMNKNDYTSLLLDGDINKTTFFGGNIDWTKIELRNPKELVTMDGQEYDGDNPKELIDNTSPYYDATNKVHVNTASAKSLMERQSLALGMLIAETDNELAKNIFATYYDVQAMICYFIVSNVLYNYDGFLKNWIWTIYNNIAAPTFYDLDSIFGRSWKGIEVVPTSTTVILGTDPNNYITGQLVRLYKDDIDNIYKQLREKGLISVDYIMQYVNDWIARATNAAIKKNIEKWTSIPSYRSEKNMDDGTENGGFFDSPYRVEKWLVERLVTLDDYFNFN